jgi:RNA polymerase sigma factor (sigma-70 family)
MSLSYFPVDLLALVRQVVAVRDWRVLDCPELDVDWPEFARRVTATLDGWLTLERHAYITDKLLERAVVHEYSKLLHEAVGRRDTDAEARALIEVWNYVTPLIRRILRDDDRAQDVAMDVLIKVREKRDQVRDPGSFLSWAGVIAHREAVHAAKTHAREVVMTDLGGSDDVDTEALETLLAAQALGSLSGDPGEGVRTAELETGIRECLHGMRRAAEVFIGLVLHDLSVSDIALQLGMKPNAVYVVFHRARKRLQGCRKLLSDLGVDLGTKPCT